MHARKEGNEAGWGKRLKSGVVGHPFRNVLLTLRQLSVAADRDNGPIK
jgi:hypothetical protein